jgi:hypothetical protein
MFEIKADADFSFHHHKKMYSKMNTIRVQFNIELKIQIRTEVLKIAIALLAEK